MAKFRVHNASRQTRTVHLPGRGPVDVPPWGMIHVEGDGREAHAAHAGAVLVEPGQDVPIDAPLVFYLDDEPDGDDAVEERREPATAPYAEDAERDDVGPSRAEDRPTMRRRAHPTEEKKADDDAAKKPRSKRG